MLPKLAATAAAGVTLLAGIGFGGLWTVSRSPDYCGWCHVMEHYVQTWQVPGELAHLHRLVDITCQDCHPQTMGDLLHEIAVTVQGDYVVPLPQLKLPMEECLTCHGEYGDLATATADREVNPHASHLGEEPCYQCHRMHERSPGMKYCMACHHTGELVRCRQCHEDR